MRQSVLQQETPRDRIPSRMRPRSRYVDTLNSEEKEGLLAAINDETVSQIIGGKGYRHSVAQQYLDSIA